jgi:hypothetical protein
VTLPPFDRLVLTWTAANLRCLSLWVFDATQIELTRSSLLELGVKDDRLESLASEEKRALVTLAVSPQAWANTPFR